MTTETPLKNYSMNDVLNMLGKYDFEANNHLVGATQFVKVADKRVTNMINKIKKSFSKGHWKKVPLEVMVDDPIKITIEITDDINYHIMYASNEFHVLVSDNFRLELYAFDDGIMINSIVVNENMRGKGLGTKVINKLYDISERMEIPLYLIPFPAVDTFDQSKIYDIINPLKDFYTKLGFGLVGNRGLIWSNY